MKHTLKILLIIMIATPIIFLATACNKNGGGGGKTIPHYTLPTGLTATFGQTLSQIQMPFDQWGVWTWTHPNNPVGGAGTQIHPATFTPTNTTAFQTIQRDVTITVNRATPPGVITPIGLTAVFGQTLSLISLPTRWFWDIPTNVVGTVGPQAHNATFIPVDNVNYASVPAILTVTVAPGPPVYQIPTGLAATFGDNLSAVAFPPVTIGTPGTWTWANPNALVGDVGTNYHNATFTPTDTLNIQTITRSVPVTVSHGTPIIVPPSGITATFGDLLQDVTFPVTGHGVWTWANSTDLVGSAGSQTHNAVFTPHDTNLAPQTLAVTITVARATPDPESPTDLTATTGQTLADVTLPTGWTWVNPNTPLTTTGDFPATYTPADTANFNHITRDLIVTIA